jgi:hypothetical protein
VSDKRIYVERRPEGDYAVRKPNADRASAIESTQKRAIERAKEIAPGASPTRGARAPHHAWEAGSMAETLS